MSAIDSVTNSSSSTTSTPSNQLSGSKDEFLKLFMAQLQHQDPFAPTSGADMVAQLAQLSQVEQAKETNSQLGDLAAAQASASSAGMANLVGRSCTADASGFSIDGTSTAAPPPITVNAGAPLTGASIVITDADGKEVRRIAVPDGSKSATVQWDGKDEKGIPLPAGSYSMTVDTGKTAQAATATFSGLVEAVELTDAGPRLRMGDILIAPADIRTIGVPQ